MNFNQIKNFYALHRGTFIARSWLIAALLMANVLATESVYSTPRLDRTNPTRISNVDIPRLWWELLHEEGDVFALNSATASWVVAYMGIALHEAVIVDLIEPPSFTSHLAEMPEMPIRETDFEYDPASGAIGALSVVTEALILDTLSSKSNGRVVSRAVNGLRNIQTRDRLRYVDRDNFDRSYMHGTAIGQAIVEWTRQHDLATKQQNFFTIPKGNDAYWQPIPRSESAMEPYWGTLPLLLDSSDTSCTISPHMPFDTRPGSTFHMQAKEAYDFTQELSSEQNDIVHFWANSDTASAVTRWMVVASRITDERGFDLVDAANLYARLGIAFHDVGILAWRTKYETFLLRPETYINRYIDRAWTPLQDTPNSPSYVSATAAYGSAGATILTSIFGISNFMEMREDINEHQIIRHFTTFEALAYEGGMAQLYSGLNYRSSIEAGWRQGRCIGRLI